MTWLGARRCYVITVATRRVSVEKKKKMLSVKGHEAPALQLNVGVGGCDCAVAHLQAGMDHAVLPSQTQILMPAQSLAQLIAHDLKGHADIPTLHLPDRGKTRWTERGEEEGRDKRRVRGPQMGTQTHTWRRKQARIVLWTDILIARLIDRLIENYFPGCGSTYLIFPVSTLPAYCMPVSAMYILRISLVP